MAINSTGDVVLGPSLAAVGRAGEGSLAIDGGSAVVVTTNPVLAGGYNAIQIGETASGRGSVTVDGPGSELTATGGAGNINVARAGEGRLSITNGAEANGFFIVVGRAAGSNGLLQVDGPGSVLTASDAFGSFTTYTGYAGFLRAGRDFGSYGRIEITNGGTINVQNDPQSTYDVPVFNLGRNYGSTGVLLVDGPGSVLNLFQTGPSDDAPVIGDMPTADNLFNGPYFSLGYRGGSGFATVQNGGAINVFGEDAALEIGQQNIGGAGENELAIFSGGTVSVTSVGNRVGPRVSVGREEGTTGRLIIDGPGSRLDVLSDKLDGFSENRSAEVYIGERGSGELVLTGGAQLHVDGTDDDFAVVAIGLGQLDGGAAAVGTARVAGAGTALVIEGGGGTATGLGADGVLAVGVFAGSEGALSIEAGARVETLGANSGVTIANAPGATGRVTVSGEGSVLASEGTLLIGAFAEVGETGVDPAAGGTGLLEIRQGGRVAAETVILGTAGQLSGDGTLAGALTLYGGLDIAGEGIGRLDVEGSLMLMSGARLDLDIGALDGGSGDLITVTGDADFGLGGLAVDLTLPAVPAALRGVSLVVAEVGGVLTPGAQGLAPADGARVALETRGDNLMLDVFRPTETGGPGPDMLAGTDGVDTILALEGDDRFLASPGDDLLHGGLGWDALIFAGVPSTAVTVTLGENLEAQVAAGAAGLGTDQLVGIEQIAFADGTLFLDVENAALAATYRLYVAGLGREPDAGGLEFWQAILEGPAGITGVAQSFVDSPEFAMLFGSDPAPGVLVTGFYENVLERPPDAGGQAFWTQQVTSGAITTAELLIAFSESPENVTRSDSAFEDGLFL